MSHVSIAIQDAADWTPCRCVAPLFAVRGMARLRFGLSLVETIVVIAIVGILIGIVLPALSGVRRAQMRSVNLANLRSIAQIAAIYAGDNADRWMGATEWDQSGRASYGSGDSFVFFLYDFEWPLHAIATGYADESLLSLRSPYRELDVPRPYAMSCTMMTDARFWALETRTGMGQFGSPGMHEIAFPSEKTTFFDSPAWFMRLDGLSRGPMHQTAGADGSAKAAPRMRGGEVPSGDGFYPGSIHPFSIGNAQHSVGGVRARDRYAGAVETRSG